MTRTSTSYLLVLLMLFPLLAGSALAQEETRMELGAEVRYWSLTSNPVPFTGQTSTGVGLRATLRPHVRSRYALSISGGWAPEGSFDAGAADLSLDLSLRFAATPNERSANGFLSLSAGAIYIDAAAQRATADACKDMPGCMLEVELLTSGTRATIGMGMGMELPVTGQWMLQPEARVLVLFNNNGTGFATERYITRLGLGVVWH